MQKQTITSEVLTNEPLALKLNTLGRRFQLKFRLLMYERYLLYALEDNYLIGVASFLMLLIYFSFGFLLKSNLEN